VEIPTEFRSIVIHKKPYQAKINKGSQWHARTYSYFLAKELFQDMPIIAKAYLQ